MRSRWGPPLTFTCPTRGSADSTEPCSAHLLEQAPTRPSRRHHRQASQPHSAGRTGRRGHEHAPGRTGRLTAASSAAWRFGRTRRRSPKKRRTASSARPSNAAMRSSSPIIGRVRARLVTARQSRSAIILGCETRAWSTAGQSQMLPARSALLTAKTQVRSCPHTSQTPMSADPDARFELGRACTPTRSGGVRPSVRVRPRCL